MAPLVPGLISDQVSLILAFFIGIAFGWILEQAGFSSAKRLVGLFYGYDFTVLRVFFTAAVTAAIGLILLGQAGLLDLTAIFVNPLWLKPAIAGGVIMGLGFILGGYCPGTSIAALSIGKLDALFFVVGGVLGIFLFGAAYPSIQAFSDSTPMGPLTVYDFLGISPGAFVLGLTVAALLAFAAAGAIERKLAPDTAPSKTWNPRWPLAGAAAALALAFVLGFLPSRQEAMIQRASSAHRLPVRMVPPDELAFRLSDRDPRTQVFDLRPAEDFARLPLPASASVRMDQLFTNELVGALSRRHILKVVVADKEEDAALAARIMGLMGYVNVGVLEGGMPAFKHQILEAARQPVLAGQSRPEQVRRQFRADARAGIERLIAEAKAKGAGAPKVRKAVKGGC